MVDLCHLSHQKGSKGFTDTFRVLSRFEVKEETILLKAREQKDASLVSLFATFPWGGSRAFSAPTRGRERERDKEKEKEREREREKCSPL